MFTKSDRRNRPSINIKGDADGRPASAGSDPLAMFSADRGLPWRPPLLPRPAAGGVHPTASRFSA